MNNPQLEDGYVRIAHELFEALYLSPFSGSEFRVLLFIIRQTYGYGHKSRFLTVPYIAKGTGISQSTVEKLVPKLKKNNVIVSQINGAGKQEIGIEKHFRKWKGAEGMTLPKTECRKWKYPSENGMPKSEVLPFRNRKLDPSENGSQIKKEEEKKEKEKKDILSLTSFSPFEGETCESKKEPSNKPLIEYSAEQRKALNTDLAKRKMKDNGWTAEEFLKWRFQ